MWSDDMIKGKILHKLTRRGKFEHSHTAIEHLQSGFPKHIVGRAKGCVQDLVRDGLLKAKPTEYGLHISINLERSDEVMMYIDGWLEE